MSLEQPTMTWRPSVENALFIEGTHRNHFPFLSRNAVMNLFITWSRLYSEAKNINLPQDMAQRVLSISLCTNDSRPGPRKVETQKVKAGVA